MFSSMKASMTMSISQGLFLSIQTKTKESFGEENALVTISMYVCDVCILYVSLIGRARVGKLYVSYIFLLDQVSSVV